MAEAPSFSYADLFAKSAPGPRQRGAIRRGRYDFAVAYVDSGSVPLEGLAESLRAALQEEGADLALYPHPQGYPPLREFVAEKLTRDRNIRVSADDIYMGDGSGEPIHNARRGAAGPRRHRAHRGLRVLGDAGHATAVSSGHPRSAV